MAMHISQSIDCHVVCSLVVKAVDHYNTQSGSYVTTFEFNNLWPANASRHLLWSPI